MNLSNDQLKYLKIEWETLLDMVPNEFPLRTFDNFHDAKKYLLTELICPTFKRNLAMKYCYMPSYSNESEVYILARLQMWAHQKLIARLGNIKHFYKFILLYEEEYGKPSAMKYYNEIREQMLKVRSCDDLYGGVSFYIPIAYPTKNQWTIETMIINTETVETLSKHQHCPICLDDVPSYKSIITNCNHQFCQKCICEHIDISTPQNIPKCPMCRTVVHQFEIKDFEYYDELHEKYDKPIA